MIGAWVLVAGIEINDISGGLFGLFLGAIILGTVHGILPDHGWPVAAMYSLNQKQSYLHGLISGFVLGFGHLVSSIFVVVAYFWALNYFDVSGLPYMDQFAGAILIILGVREYVRGGHSHDHGDHDHGEANGDGLLAKIKMFVPFVGSDDAHEHTHSLEERADERGLWGITAFAFILGFAHNEEIEIIAICTGSIHCLELMFAYAMAVLIMCITMTLLLIAGFEHFEDSVEEYRDYLPVVTASVLILMGFGFVVGLF